MTAYWASIFVHLLKQSNSPSSILVIYFYSFILHRIFYCFVLNALWTNGNYFYGISRISASSTKLLESGERDFELLWLQEEDSLNLRCEHFSLLTLLLCAAIALSQCYFWTVDSWLFATVETLTTCALQIPTFSGLYVGMYDTLYFCKYFVLGLLPFLSCPPWFWMRLSWAAFVCYFLESISV